MSEHLYRIEAPHFVAAFLWCTHDKVVFNVAPIIQYLNRWSLEDIKDYCRRKGWKIERVKEKP